MTSVNGQAAEVRVMSIVAMLPSSTETPYTSPRSTTLMPNSGSTTSFIASMTSSSFATVDSMPHLPFRLIYLDTCFESSILQSHPRQERALDTRWILGNANEGNPVPQYLFIGLRAALGMHELNEGPLGSCHIRESCALDQFGHHTGAGLGDRATLTFVTHVDVTGVIHVHPDGHLIAACGVDLVTLAGRSGQWARTPRMLVVVENDLLVEGFDVAAHATPKNCCAA